jgi:hypothetical protein
MRVVRRIEDHNTTTRRPMNRLNKHPIVSLNPQPEPPGIMLNPQPEPPGIHLQIAFSLLPPSPFRQ